MSYEQIEQDFPLSDGWESAYDVEGAAEHDKEESPTTRLNDKYPKTDGWYRAEDDEAIYDSRQIEPDVAAEDTDIVKTKHTRISQADKKLQDALDIGSGTGSVALVGIQQQEILEKARYESPPLPDMRPLPDNIREFPTTKVGESTVNAGKQVDQEVA